MNTTILGGDAGSFSAIFSSNLSTSREFCRANIFRYMVYAPMVLSCEAIVTIGVMKLLLQGLDSA